MFARLCTTIRWLGTAMFVAVLIVWGVAAVRPMQTVLDLPTRSETATHQLALQASGDSLFLFSSKHESLNYGDPNDTSSLERSNSHKILGLFIRYGKEYPGRGFKQFPILSRNPGELAPVTQPTPSFDFSATPPYGSTLMLSGHWWHLLALTLPFAARTTQLSIRRRRTRANPTACKSCGYDLRAGHEKCPECGGESHVLPVIETK